VDAMSPAVFEWDSRFGIRKKGYWHQEKLSLPVFFQAIFRKTP
jgi:hypothetical protein